jgi:hypothetical protein
MILFLLTSLTYAEEKEPTIVYKKETSIDFEGVEIDGELIKPNGATIRERATTGFNPLISLRTDFNHEMKASISEIK